MKTIFLFPLIRFIISVNAYQNNLSLTNTHDETAQKVVDAFICKNNRSWCTTSNYQKNEEPWKFRHFSNSVLPFNYQFIFNIVEIEEINDITQTISINFYFRITWKEPRLIIDQNHSEWQISDRNSGALSYQSDILDILWTPDLEISRLKEFEAQHILDEMSGVEIFKSQHIRYNAKVGAKFSCKMYFDRYPLDYHRCTFRIGSYLYTDKVINCSAEFTTKPQHQRSLQYHIDFLQLAPEDGYLEVQENRFSMCGFAINLHRNRIQIFFQVYLTCILFVVVSWASFTIDPEVVPGRMGLLVTTFLVLINIFNGAQLNAPVTSFLNAIDIYILGCIGHVFLVLCEYVIVLSKNKFPGVWKRKTIRPQRNNRRTMTWPKGNLSKHTHDSNSLILFPLIFIMFNVIYWIMFY